MLVFAQIIVCLCASKISLRTAGKELDHNLIDRHNLCNAKNRKRYERKNGGTETFIFPGCYFQLWIFTISFSFRIASKCYLNPVTITNSMTETLFFVCIDKMENCFRQCIVGRIAKCISSFIILYYRP